MEWTRPRAKVLVIEDSQVVQHLLRVTLAALGVELLFADCGESGWELVRTHRPDLIILDIGLPGIDGWQVLRALRSDPETSGTAVIVLTAHAEESMEQAAADSGADGFFGKPFQPAELRKAVGGLLEQLATDALIDL